MRRLLIAVLLIVVYGTSLAASTENNPNRTTEYRFANGLKLIVRVDRRAPVVLSSVWYKVGGSYEHSGITGLSHMLEHMMFRGTPSVSGPEFDRIISANGGQQNAMTSQDFTMYYQMLPADKLGVSFKLEADRMRNLAMQEAIFVKENQVVREERRMRIEDNPQSITYERFTAAAHVNNPYRNPVAGWMTDLENMRLSDLQTWYQRWYAPNNAVLIVVGNVDPQKVYDLALQYFSPIKASVIDPPKPRSEIATVGRREIEVKLPAKTPWLILGYNVPSIVTAKNPEEVYALELTAALLSGGSSSRLAKNLVRGEQVAVAAEAEYSIYRLHSDLFVVSAIPVMHRSLQDLQRSLLSEIKKLQTDLISQAELDRVKAQLIASKVYEKDSMMTQAMDMGAPEMIGASWRQSDEYIKRIEAVTPQQIQAVVQRYFVNTNLTVGMLHPQGEGKSHE